jgi:hypothetical protein
MNRLDIALDRSKNQVVGLGVSVSPDRTGWPNEISKTDSLEPSQAKPGFYGQWLSKKKFYNEDAIKFFIDGKERKSSLSRGARSRSGLSTNSKVSNFATKSQNPDETRLEQERYC